MASTFISLPSTTVSGTLDLHLNPIDDSVAISDGVDTLQINPDGSINVNIGGNASNVYSEIHSVASSSSFTTILSYVAPSNGKLRTISASGSNIAEFQVSINSNVAAKKYTYFGGNLNADFDFKDGIDLAMGDMVLLEVRHNRPDLADFNGNIIVLI